MNRTERMSVYISISEKVPLEDYLRRYLETRNFAVNDATLAQIRQWVARMPKSGALKKSDLDFFLDKNVKKV
jgi:hypothetical protein